MAVQHRNHFVCLGKSTLEAFDRLGCERNFRDENDRAFTALERNSDCLQIDFGLAAAGDTMQQNWFGCFGSRLRGGSFVPCESWFGVEFTTGRLNKLRLRMRIACDGFFPELD